MPGPEKLRLGENHRRVLSVLLRGVEETCNVVAGWLERKPGVLLRVENDLGPVQRERLRTLADELRGEIRRLEAEVELQPALESPRRSIRALLSAMSVEIEERKSARLAGYGPLPEDVKSRLDAELDRLILLLEKMINVVEKA